MKTKTTLFLLFLTASIGAARAQDAYGYDSDYSAAAVAVPAVVYNAPVTYMAPVAYNAPVIYNAPVFYGTAMSCALNACAAACYDTSVRSTVTYIGGGHLGFQVSPRCNYGSTVTFIGGSWYSSHN